MMGAEVVPAPSMAKRGERVVSVPHSMALKAAVYFAVREAGVSNSELARRMRLDEKGGAPSSRSSSPDEASAHRGRARRARATCKVELA